MLVFHHATVERRDNATRIHAVGDGLRRQAVRKVLGVGDNAALAGRIGRKLRPRVTTRRAHVDHGLDCRRRLSGKALPHKGIPLGHVDGARQVSGNIVGRILCAGDVHDHLGLQVVRKRIRLTDVHDQMAVALVLNRGWQ